MHLFVFYVYFSKLIHSGHYVKTIRQLDIVFIGKHHRLDPPHVKVVNSAL